MKMARKAKIRKKSRSTQPSGRKGQTKSKRHKSIPARSISKSGGAAKSTAGRPASRPKPSGRASDDQRYSVVRIMGQGQYKLDSATVDELNKLDNTIVKLIENEETKSESSDLESRFSEKLTDMISLVTREGKEVEPKEILVSDFILPPIDSTIREAKLLFSGEGLLPG